MSKYMASPMDQKKVKANEVSNKKGMPFRIRKI